MSSVRALFCLGGLVALGGLVSIACGSDAASADPAATSPDGAAQPGDDGGLADAAADGPSVNGPFTFRDRLAGWSSGYTGGWYRAHGYVIAGKRLFSLPDALSPTLGAVTVVDVSTAKPKVIALPVVGKLPAGTVESFVYEPGLDRIVMIVRALGALRVDVVTLAIGDQTATFTTLTQAGPASTSNSMVGPLLATGAPGVIVVGLGNTTASLTIAGTTATWSAESQGTIFPGNTSNVMEDPAHGRALAFGKLVYDIATMTGHTEPNILELSLAAPYTWNAKPFGGDAPPNTDNTVGASFTVYDETGNRVLASSYHDSTCGPMACKVPGLWSFNLATSTWTKLQDRWTSPHAYASTTPFLVQQDARRILEPADGTLNATSLDTNANPTLADVALTMDGDLGPTSPLGATVLGDGRIVSTDGRAFRVLDPKVAAPRWERFGTASMPPFASGASIAADPKTGELLLFGTPSGGSPTTNELQLLSSDGKVLSKVTAAASPPARSYQGALVLDGTLYIAGGTSGTTTLDDVWAFERATAQWSKIATLPSALSFATLAAGANGELLVMGRVPVGQGDAQSSPVFAIDRATHAVRTMEAMPSKVALWSMAPYRGCFIGYESGDTLDGSKPNVWRCSVANGVTTWTSTTIEEHDFTIRELRGAAAPDGLRAYFVGRHLWEAIGQ